MELSNFTGGAGRGFPQPYDGPSGTSLRTKWEERARKGDFRGAWQEGRLRVLDADPERYLSRMNRIHAAFVRLESTTIAVVEIVPE